MEHERDDPGPPGQPAREAGGAGLHLRRLAGGGRDRLPAEVRLLREFKGPTVRELTDDADLAVQLPGQVRSALQHLERGDLAAAEQALPGRFAAVLPGPGHRRAAGRGRRWSLVLLLALAAALLVAMGFG